MSPKKEERKEGIYENEKKGRGEGGRQTIRTASSRGFFGDLPPLKVIKYFLLWTGGVLLPQIFANSSLKRRGNILKKRERKKKEETEQTDIHWAYRSSFEQNPAKKQERERVYNVKRRFS